jgi:outer membrane lipoprotein-sorting protein
MAPFTTDDSNDGGQAGPERSTAGRRKAARYVVPVAVLGVAAATIGLVPALADSGDPDLPKLTAQQLVEKIAASDTEQLSGTMQISTDLGLPDLGSLAQGFTSGGGQGRSGDPGSSADPRTKLMELASGTHTLRVAADGPERQRISLLENAAEYSVIHNGDDVWAYDSKSDEAYHSTAPEHARKQKQDPGRSAEDMKVTPKEFAQEALKAADGTTSVTADGTARVAGRDAYRLKVQPKDSGTTVGAISIAVDAKTGTPLKVTLTPASGGAAVIDVGYTKVDFSRPGASAFRFTPPKGTKVTEGGPETHGSGAAAGKLPFAGGAAKDGATAKGQKDGATAKGRDGGFTTIGEGWNAVAHFDTGAAGAAAGGGSAKRGGNGGNGPAAGTNGAVGSLGALGSLGETVKGGFGTGTVFKTRLINALITDDGQVYVGAVPKDALLKAAESGK